MEKKVIGKPFQKGQSGNPSGRPKIIGHIQDLAREYTVDAVNTLVEVMRNKESPPAARVTAASALLDRGYGKAHQTSEITVKKGDARELTRAEIVEALAAEGATTQDGREGVASSVH